MRNYAHIYSRMKIRACWIFLNIMFLNLCRTFHNLCDNFFKVSLKICNYIHISIIYTYSYKNGVKRDLKKCLGSQIFKQ